MRPWPPWLRVLTRLYDMAYMLFTRVRVPYWHLHDLIVLPLLRPYFSRRYYQFPRLRIPDEFSLLPHVADQAHRGKLRLRAAVWSKRRDLHYGLDLLW